MVIDHLGEGGGGDTLSIFSKECFNVQFVCVFLKFIQYMSTQLCCYGNYITFVLNVNKSKSKIEGL